ncbi:putative conjugative transfer protein [Orientia tsutsugamushi str. UT76]|uniref:Conjugal transfer protein TraE n=1 Tax=Orientia tsutsugamushi TaxID=784 RepID=A0A2U3QSF1_ORITS|nr:conjugal transfer protein TraE [Orientia tsutsugamushi]KJV74813.1 putative conjugative transfer protein TraE [Orientia tsutsugamushi str. UT76]KJV76625.1 putative conjugative transfer protein [Orientia tsutsugamushi str. UT76]SPR03866.1 conjugal transfer protein TraE [Orientia tsutsugamushi]SPR03968.1 conjugal transfer protein TraE [Orientia tsutsugamushi]
MNHLFKQNAIQELVKYNKCLLSVTILLAAANIIAIMAANYQRRKVVINSSNGA